MAENVAVTFTGRQSRNRWSGRAWAALTVVIAIAAVAVLAMFAKLCLGSMAAGVAYLTGDRLLVDATSKSFGELADDQGRSVAFTLTNLTGRQIKVVGATSLCTCMKVETIPLAIPQGQVRTVRVTVRRGGESGRISKIIRLYTDYEGKPELDLNLFGRVPE